MPSRRTFLSLAASAALGASLPAPARAARPPRPRPDDLPEHAAQANLVGRLTALSLFGRPHPGDFESGVTRVAYSDADLEARRYVTGLIANQLRLQPRIDAAGNIFARREGTDQTLPPILFGSHIDTVPNGGNFDGALGSLAAIGLVESLDSRGIRTRHPLELVIWAHEEGVAFARGVAGSRIVAGDVTPADLDQVWDGLRRADAIRRIGGNPDRIAEARREKGSLAAYFELHIEQGTRLEEAGVAIGAVQGIVAIHRHAVTIAGFANHAGTTPMNRRQDALVAASALTLAVRDIVTAEPGTQVGTVGRLDVSPNAPNVIPGEARLIIELRDLSVDKLRRIGEAIRARAQQIAADSHTTIAMRLTSESPPASADAALQDLVAAAAEGRRLRAMRLPSMAGHDAQTMAQLAPMAMIFVPSIGGISHSPAERTSWDDCGRGATVLLDSVVAADRRL